MAGTGTPRALDTDAGRGNSIEVDVAVIGGGGAAETLAGELDGTGLRVAVIEEDRVGGDCPFVACMPSKAMLHDANTSTRWGEAVKRRENVTEHLDDRGHARQLEETGAQLIRGRGRVVDAHTVAVGDTQVHTDHIVLATGSRPLIVDIDGIDRVGDGLWTSDDALTAIDRPARLMIIGGGPIGCELAHLFAGFDTEVHLVDVTERAFPDLPDPIGDIVDDGLRAAGVRVCRGRQVERVERRGGNVLTALDNGATVVTDRILVATGRQPNTTDLGLEHLGLDVGEPVPVDDRGRVDCDGSIWAMGDVAGGAQYTHVANHHARVVANQLVGDHSRRFSDVVTPASIFTQPPVIMIGPTPEATDDVIWVEARMSEVARWTTDALGDGFLTVAIDPSTRCAVAAHGAGARFDELSAALITAIDASVPVDVLHRSMWAFPTVAELLGLIYARAIDALDDIDAE
jgi:pyruvate/2-oxoglutarate dehydrogenase complex dihydrolipoamide dehydrogenase (E3) component